MAKYFAGIVRGLQAPLGVSPGARYVARSQTISPIAIANIGGHQVSFASTGDPLPTGLSLDPDTGIISGTVDAGANVEVVNAEITLSNSGGTSIVAFTIDVRASFTTIDSGDTFPYIANAVDELYVLTESIAANGTAIALLGDNAVLDGQGNTIAYDAATPITISNSSFEFGTGADADDWDFTNAPNAQRHNGQFLDNDVYDGEYSIKFTDTTADEYVESLYAIELEANTTYSISAMVMYGTPNTSNPGVEMYASLVGASTHEAMRNLGNNRGIQLIYGVFTTGESPETYTVRVGIRGHASSVVPVFIDDIKVQRHKVYGVCMGAKTWDQPETPDVNTYETASNAVVTNCVITQGAAHGSWSHGIFCYGNSGQKLINNVITVNGVDTCCIYDKDAYTYSCVIESNTLTSNCRTISNRDQGYGAVVFSLQGIIANNTITNGCHNGFKLKSGISGLRVASTVYGNTIRLKSRYTNGFAILSGYGSAIYENTIDCGTGEYSSRGIGIAGEDGGDTTHCYSNTIEVQALDNNQEYGGVVLGGAYGIQIENAHNVNVYGNTVIANGNVAMAYAMRINTDLGTASGISVYSNTFVANDNGVYAACCKFSGVSDAEVSFQNNTLVTNNGLVGATSDTMLTLSGCVIRYNSSSPGSPQHVIEADYYSGTEPHVAITFLNPSFYDTGSAVYMRGASVDNPDYYGGGHNIRGLVNVDWSIECNVEDAGGSPIAGASVVIDNAHAVEVVNDTTGGDGAIDVVLREFQTVGGTKTSHTPHDATASAGGETDSISLTVDGQKSVTFTVAP